MERRLGLDVLKGASIVFVVFNHALLWPMRAGDLPSAFLYGTAFGTVAAFSAVAGYVQGLHPPREEWAILRKRAGQLLVPWALWAPVYAVAPLVWQGVCHGTGTGRSRGGRAMRLTRGTAVFCIATGVSIIALWTMLFVTGQVADAETHHGRIEACVRAGEALGVPLDIPQARGQGRAGHFGPPRRHHGPIDVIDDHAPGVPHGPGGPEGQVGGAAAHVQDPHPRL